MSLCPATHPDTGAQCERWPQPAAHVMDGSHQAGTLRWPYIPAPRQLVLDLAPDEAASVAPALKEAPAWQ